MNRFLLSLKGFAMGIAESIPGVSGGTIAFITGIYETLIHSIESFSPQLFTIYKKNGFKGIWNTVNGNFLMVLLIGMAIGLISGILGVTYLLENYPPVIWAFFFGLIIASIIHVGKQISQWNFSTILALIIGAIVAYSITLMPVGSGNESLIYIFFAGVIAISAMLLPGISGSFILLLMGVYQYLFHDLVKVKLFEEHDLSALIPIGIMTLGCIVGILSFSRLLSWFLKNYHALTLAGLTGFMIGSLNKLWPWRIPILGLDENDKIVNFEPGVVLDKVIKEKNVLPTDYSNILQEPSFLTVSVLTLLLGFSLVFLLEKLDVEK